MALKMTLLSGKPIGKFEDKFYKVFQIEKKKRNKSKKHNPTSPLGLGGLAWGVCV